MSGTPGRALVVEVHLLSDRWHGNVDWPPSPFRLFQALVAGAYGGRWSAEEDGVAAAKDAAFAWLESLAPPAVARPAKLSSSRVQYFVPNNDLDAVGSDPRRSGEIRTPKVLQSAILAAPATVAYLWRFGGDEEHARRLVSMCERLHTFGRGIDAAYATARIVAAGDADSLWSEGPLRRCEPSAGPGGSETRLPCPSPGSLESLKRRFRETSQRLRKEQSGGKAVVRFRQPEKARSRIVAYDVSPETLVFELLELAETGQLYPYRLELAAPLAAAIRDLTFRRLTAAMGREAELERAILGRGAGNGQQRIRVRVIPLPSLGTEHTDPSIRRVVVQIPPDCPLEASDLRWALVGQRVPPLGGGEREGGARLVESRDEAMLWQYGFVGKACERWRTVTPAVLPVRLRPGPRSGSERRLFEELAALSVADAVRHAGIEVGVREVRSQREPFVSRGKRAEAFESDRFAVGRLRHVELVLQEPRRGPLLIGDGRWLGLGLLHPVRKKADDALESSVARSIEAVAEPDDADDSEAAETAADSE
ncbi:MAG: type I-U CRISPR-associated protein Csb2 [Candidatus Baltobacteraceae bacterium]|jgi:CRISPR-associated protein Csb2